MPLPKYHHIAFDHAKDPKTDIVTGLTVVALSAFVILLILLAR